MNTIKTEHSEIHIDFKNSGTSWLGEIPQHWEVRRLKDLGYLKSGTGFPHSHQGNLFAEFPFFKVGDMAVSGNEQLMQVWNHTITEDTVNTLGAHVFQPNTIVFAKVGAALLLNRRRILTRPSCLDNNMMGFLPKGHSSKWMYHWLSTVDLRMMVNPGAVPSVNEGQLEVLPVLVPPLPEQASIVRYLDNAEEQIQAYIGAKQKLIALLEEQRQAIIHQAVTKGLDPNVRLKPSSVEWLGEVPEHWEVTTAKRKYIIQIGKMLQPSPKTEDDKEVQYLRALNIQWENLVTHDIATMWASSEEIAQLQVQPTDLLVCEGGAGAGNSTIVEDVPEGIIIQNSVHRVRARKASSNKFLLYILKTSVDLGWLEVLNNKATIPHFTKEKFETFRIALPPIWEQEAIIEHLNKSKQSIDEATDRARRQIELMQEYRTRLIADVVTGKLDVREAAEDLPQLEPTDITN